MITYIADIIPKIQQYSKKLDDLTKLQNQHWVSIGNLSDTKTVYIFRDNKQLLISENGRAQKGSWEYLGNQSLLIETPGETLLLKHGFFDENVIALKLDSTNTYAFFVNENKYGSELNNIEDVLGFLKDKYYSPKPGGLGSNKKGGNLNNEFGYTILEEKEDYSFSVGHHRYYKILFNDGNIDFVYKGGKSGRFFYYHLANGLTYCVSLEDAIIKLWKHNN